MIKHEGCDSPSNVTPPTDIRGKKGKVISWIGWRCTTTIGIVHHDYEVKVDDKSYSINDCWLEAVS